MFGFALDEPDYPRLAADFERRFGRSAFDAALSAGRWITVWEEASIPQPGQKKKRKHRFDSRTGFLSYMDRVFGPTDPEDEHVQDSGWSIYTPDAGWRCEIQTGYTPLPCCMADSNALCGGDSHYSTLSRVCFWPESADRALPVTIELVYCGFGGY